MTSSAHVPPLPVLGPSALAGVSNHRGLYPRCRLPGSPVVRSPLIYSSSIISPLRIVLIPRRCAVIIIAIIAVVGRALSISFNSVPVFVIISIGRVIIVKARSLVSICVVCVIRAIISDSLPVTVGGLGRGPIINESIGVPIKI